MTPTSKEREYELAAGLLCLGYVSKAVAYVRKNNPGIGPDVAWLSLCSHATFAASGKMEKNEFYNEWANQIEQERICEIKEEIVTRYRTKDGAVFDSLEEAQCHMFHNRLVLLLRQAEVDWRDTSPSEIADFLARNRSRVLDALTSEDI